MWHSGCQSVEATFSMRYANFSYVIGSCYRWHKVIPTDRHSSVSGRRADLARECAIKSPFVVLHPNRPVSLEKRARQTTPLIAARRKDGVEPDRAIVNIRLQISTSMQKPGADSGIPDKQRSGRFKTRIRETRGPRIRATAWRPKSNWIRPVI
jgi:hypothetical protein